MSSNERSNVKNVPSKNAIEPQKHDQVKSFLVHELCQFIEARSVRLSRRVGSIRPSWVNSSKSSSCIIDIYLKCQINYINFISLVHTKSYYQVTYHLTTIATNNLIYLKHFYIFYSSSFQFIYKSITKTKSPCNEKRIKRQIKKNKLGHQRRNNLTPLFTSTLTFPPFFC